MHAACDRARQWATAEVDGELSRFEIVLLRAHLDACPSCREFHVAVGGITRTLRATPLERLERAIEVRRLRWRIRSRLAPAAAAMAVAAVVLGSGVVSSSVRTGSVGDTGSSVDGVARLSSAETMNLSKLEALTQSSTSSAGLRTLTVRAQGSLRGGPVIRDR
ncbi:MAG TPA: zf-HC2 domain-containing protein [Gaiellaceae bacterium]|nr:zf-HC2 domain-containing protein [Gaiellaceae bacterium]